MAHDMPASLLHGYAAEIGPRFAQRQLVGGTAKEHGVDVGYSYGDEGSEKTEGKRRRPASATAGARRAGEEETSNDETLRGYRRRHRETDVRVCG